MIALVVTDSMSHELEEIRGWERYTFYDVKATEVQAIYKEIHNLVNCTQVVVEVAMFDKEDGKWLLEQLLEQYNVIVLAIGLNPYDIVLRDYFNMGITSVLTVTGKAMYRELNDLLYESKREVEETLFEPEKKEVIEEDAVKSVQKDIKQSRIENDKAVTISFAGAGHRIGTTTQVLQFAWFIKSMFATVAVVDFSKHKWLDVEMLPGCSRVCDGEYNINKLPWFTDARKVPRLQKEYDYILFDYGDFGGLHDITSFVEKDIQIIVCGYKPDEQKHFEVVCDSDIGNYWYMINHVAPADRSMILEQMGDLQEKTLFTAYSPSYMRYCGEDKLYSAVIASAVGSALFSPRGRAVKRENTRKKSRWMIPKFLRKGSG